MRFKAIGFLALLPLAGCGLLETDNISASDFVPGPHAQACKAQVTGIDDSGETINDDPVALLTMDVTPPSAPPYTVQARVLVSRLAVPQVGDVLDVSCDPANPKNTKVID